MKKSQYSTAYAASREAESAPVADAQRSDSPMLDSPVPPVDPSLDRSEILECPVELATAIADNMAVGNLKPKGGDTPGFRIVGGIDTLCLALSIEWGPRFEETVKLLQRCQDNAKKGDDNGSYFRLGDQVCRVYPNGGGRGKGCFRHWIFDGCGMHFEVSKHSAPGDDYFNAVVTVGSVTCNAVPLDDLWERVQLVIRCLGGRILNEAVSRVDLYQDDPNTYVGKVFAAWQEDCIITRARSWSLFGDRKDGQTFQVGKETRLRVYNKLAELRAKPDARKEEQIRGRYGGELPQILTRFEFQLRRKFLRESGINRFADLRTNLNTIGSYLVRQWIRFAERKVDRRQADKAVTAVWWDKIARAFEAIGDDAKKNLVRATTKVKNSKALIRQAFGCLLKAVHSNCVSIADFLSEMYEQIKQTISDIGNNEFYARLARCHAMDATQLAEIAISGSPKFVSAEDVLRRLGKLFKYEEKTDAEREFLFWRETETHFVGEGWPDNTIGEDSEDDFLF